MKRSMVLDSGMLERLTAKPDYENIVIGTGAPARDLRTKLLLLGLRVPFLIGGRAEPEQGIRHYNEIAGLGDPKRYRFILCCDRDEWELMAPAQMAAYAFLGITAWNHPQVIKFSAIQVLWENAGDYITDAINCNTFLRDGHPYAVFGNGLADSLHIHILGSCQSGDLVRFSKDTVPKLLHSKLERAGLSSTIYAWGQPNNPVGDDIMRCIRDVCFHKCDLLIQYSGANVNPLHNVTKNALATTAGSVGVKHPFIWQCQSLDMPASNGIDHDVDAFTLRKTQQRIFLALAKLHGFSFWDVLSPTSRILSGQQAMALKGRPPGYFFRQKQRKDMLLSVLDERYTKDYTEIFRDVDDIYAMFADSLHLSSEGNRLVAERFAADILEAFQK
jgi:hypothetical protein